jgi:hypothetical protein
VGKTRDRAVKAALLAIVAVLVGAGLVLLGRMTVARPPGHDSAYQTGRSDGYVDGLRVGEAQGREEGRALQEGNSLPAGSRTLVQDAFKAGYDAGANDVFAGYDGGWAFGTPYVVTLEQGSGQIVYRIRARTPFQAGVTYDLCPNGRDLCQQPQS